MSQRRRSFVPHEVNSISHMAAHGCQGDRNAIGGITSDSTPYLVQSWMSPSDCNNVTQPHQSKAIQYIQLCHKGSDTSLCNV